MDLFVIEDISTCMRAHPLEVEVTRPSVLALEELCLKQQVMNVCPTIAKVEFGVVEAITALLKLTTTDAEVSGRAAGASDTLFSVVEASRVLMIFVGLLFPNCTDLANALVCASVHAI